MMEHDSQRLEFALRAIQALQDRVAVLERRLAQQPDADNAEGLVARPARCYGYQYPGNIPGER